jgi:hypothetical protein
MDSNSELGKLVYALINLCLIACSLVLRRRTFLVFGALGLFGYLGHLAYRVFNDSVLFPFILSLLGIAVIYLGMQYQRRHKQIEQGLRSLVVPRIRGLLPPRALEE